MAKRYQRSNQKLLREEEQTTQWPKEKGQKDKFNYLQNTTHKTIYNNITFPPIDDILMYKECITYIDLGLGTFESNRQGESLLIIIT